MSSVREEHDEGSLMGVVERGAVTFGSARAVLKALVEKSLVAGGCASVGRYLHRGRTLILAYHNVVPEKGELAGDSSLHLPRSEFARHLDLLSETHRVLPLEEALAPGPEGRPRAAVTFDDAYRGAVTAGVDELARRGLPATVFVNPGLLGRPGFWWDELTPRGAVALPDGLREEALDRGRGIAEEVYRWAAGRGLERRSLPAHAGVATEEELAAAAGTPGITLGSHAWSHANLARLDAEELEDELSRPLGWLRDRFPEAVCPWLSLPYGRSGPGVERAVREAGYEGALRVTGGLAGADVDRYSVPRVNVPAGVSDAGFVLRTAGL